MNEIVYQDETYRSLRSFAEHFGFKYNNFYRIYEKGYTLDEAIEQYKQQYGTPKFSVFGESFKNSAEICHRYQLNFALYTGLVRKGVSPEEAVRQLTDTVAKRRNTSTVSDSRDNSHDMNKEATYRNKTYKTYYSLCSNYGISPSYVRRVQFQNSVLSWEKAFDLIVTFLDKLEIKKPPFIEATPIVIYNDIWYFHESVFAKDCGIRPTLFDKYLKAYDDASYLEVMQMIRKEWHIGFVYNGETYATQSEVEEAYGGKLKQGVSRGKITRTTVIRYPECKFMVKDDTIDTLKLFYAHKKQYLADYLKSLI